MERVRVMHSLQKLCSQGILQLEELHHFHILDACLLGILPTSAHYPGIDCLHVKEVENSFEVHFCNVALDR